MCMSWGGSDGSTAQVSLLELGGVVRGEGGMAGWRVRRVCVTVFFFQAEDGIRDLTVTGVQTCALPISPRQRPPSAKPGWPKAASMRPRVRLPGFGPPQPQRLQGRRFRRVPRRPGICRFPRAGFERPQVCRVPGPECFDCRAHLPREIPPFENPTNQANSVGGADAEGVPAGDQREGLLGRSEEHTSELQSQSNLVCRLLLEK